MADGAVRLPDGRTLAYTEFGHSPGRALLYFGSSRLEAGLLDEPATQAGVRLIGLDRPGIGLSTFQPGRRLLDWPGDVAEVGDQLGIGRFAVVGLSAGGPHALACAYAIPDRLTNCGVVSGVGPVTLRMYQRAPWLLSAMVHLMGRLFRDEAHAATALTRFTRGWPESDRACLAIPGVRERWSASLAESFRQGSRGMSYDSVLVEARRWGFDLADITRAQVHLWHGELDQDVPVAMGRVVAEGIRGCTPTFYPGEGHLSALVNHGDEIVSALTS